MADEVCYVPIADLTYPVLPVSRLMAAGQAAIEDFISSGQEFACGLTGEGRSPNFFIIRLAR